MVSYFLEECPRYDLDMLYGKGGESDITSQFLDLCLEEITKLRNFTSSELERILRDACDNKGFSIRQSFGSLRTAMTGRTATPPLFAIMEVMGRQRVIDRLEAAVRKVA